MTARRLAAQQPDVYPLRDASGQRWCDRPSKLVLRPPVAVEVLSRRHRRINDLIPVPSLLFALGVCGFAMGWW